MNQKDVIPVEVDTSCLRSKRSFVRIEPGVPDIGEHRGSVGGGPPALTKQDLIETGIKPGCAAVTVPLSRGYHALVDEADEHVLNHKWTANVCGSGRPYAIRSMGGRVIYLHRFVLGVHEDRYPLVDHVNGDSLDCRRANLRICSATENGRNRLKGNTRTYTSPYKGVSRRANGKYRAAIKHQGRTIALGAYPTPESAAIAYDTAARLLFGEFARTNFSAGDLVRKPHEELAASLLARRPR